MFSRLRDAFDAQNLLFTARADQRWPKIRLNITALRRHCLRFLTRRNRHRQSPARCGGTQGQHHRPDRRSSRRGPWAGENAAEKDRKSAERGPCVCGRDGNGPSADRSPFVLSRVRRVAADQVRRHRIPGRVDKPARVAIYRGRRPSRPRRDVGDRGHLSKCARAPRPSSGKRPTRVEGDRHGIGLKTGDPDVAPAARALGLRRDGDSRFSGGRITGRPEITGRTASLLPRPLVIAVVPECPAFLRDSLVQKRQGKVRLVAARTDLLSVHIPRRLNHAFVRCRSVRVTCDRGGIDVHAPFRIEAFAVAAKSTSSPFCWKSRTIPLEAICWTNESLSCCSGTARHATTVNALRPRTISRFFIQPTGSRPAAPPRAPPIVLLR